MIFFHPKQRTRPVKAQVMKHHLVAILGGLLSVLVLFGPMRQAAGPGTAFTYQGQLASEGAPANGSFDPTFSLFDVSINGTAVAGPITSRLAIRHGQAHGRESAEELWTGRVARTLARWPDFGCGHP
jgi:hypothetical protein